jgi:hypothetical protein
MLLFLSGCAVRVEESETVSEGETQVPVNVFEEIYYDRLGMRYMSERVLHFEHFSENPMRRYYLLDSKDAFRYHLDSGEQVYYQMLGYIDSLEGHSYSTMKDFDTLEIVTIQCDFEEQTIQFSHQTLNPDNFVTQNVYLYSLQTQQLTYETNDSAQTERDTFLFDLIVPEWIYYNDPIRELSDCTHFSDDDLGTYEADWE